ncbi:hypothetical protein NDU88_001185 [Pleurodeles waltl]|uniref:Uncharacterized protein n=1 Tax=Pleurodeles waltl TaxID=8319 RepID=A0AAV7ML21_PLEWA|nr:hypothetical protein NDU88_001185 [Pleurodeles waltl]
MVLAGASLARSSKKSSWAASDGSEAREWSGRGETRAGLLTASPARAGCRAGRREDPRLFPEVCGRVLNYAWGLLGDSVGSRPCNALGFCGAATEEALLGPATHLGPGGLDGRGRGPDGDKPSW